MKPADQPATKQDLLDSQEEMAIITNNALERELTPMKADIAELKEDVAELKDGQERLERGQEAILNVVQSIDKKLESHKDLPERMARVEAKVFG